MLGQYKFKIIYRLGKENGRVDTLSRRSDIAGIKEIIRITILRTNEDRIISPI